MVQENRLGHMLLHGVRKEDLQGERHQLARARPCCMSWDACAPTCMAVDKQGSCELNIGLQKGAGAAREVPLELQTVC